MYTPCMHVGISCLPSTEFSLCCRSWELNSGPQAQQPGRSPNESTHTFQVQNRKLVKTDLEPDVVFNTQNAEAKGAP